MGKLEDICVLKILLLYFSKLMGLQDQLDYINVVCLIEIVLKFYGLLKQFQCIEFEEGCECKGECWGFWIFDLDILLYGSENIDIVDLIILYYGMVE